MLKKLALNYYYLIININSIKQNRETGFTVLCIEMNKINRIDKIVISDRIKWLIFTFKVFLVYVH